MADDFFGKGIPLTSGFDLSAKSPLDSRLVVDTIEERDNHVIKNRAYIGMRVFVISELKEYIYTGLDWKEVLNEDSLINIDLSQYATLEQLDTSLSTKSDIDHEHEEYLIEIPMEYVEDTDWENVDWETIGKDLGSFATKNDILTHRHDEDYVLREEMHDPPNFSYLINPIDLQEDPEVIIEGDYPDLSITLNIPVFSGSYNDLSNKPTIPELISQLENDLGYVTNADLEEFITNADLTKYVTFDELEQMDFATTNYVDQQISNHDHLVITDNEIKDIVEEI